MRGWRKVVEVGMVGMVVVREWERVGGGQVGMVEEGEEGERACTVDCRMLQAGTEGTRIVRRLREYHFSSVSY